MRRTVLVVTLVAVAAIGAAPASALSCAQPPPIDWATRLPAADGAVIGVVEELKTIDDERIGGQLTLRVRVTEVLHGRAPAILEYTTANFDPWGPYYEVGQEIAIVIEDGTISDGQMNLCGPWFSPDELRLAADDFGDHAQSRPGFVQRMISFLEILLQILFGR